MNVISMTKTVEEVGKNKSGKAQSAYEGMKALICANQIRPNERLTPQSFAAYLGSGVTPVREAFQKLAAEGLINWAPTRGHFSKVYHCNDLARLHEVARAILCFATRDYLFKSSFECGPASSTKYRAGFTTGGAMGQDRAIVPPLITTIVDIYDRIIAPCDNVGVTKIVSNFLDRTHAISMIDTVRMDEPENFSAEVYALESAMSSHDAENVARALQAHFTGRLRRLPMLTREANAAACCASLP